MGWRAVFTDGPLEGRSYEAVGELPYSGDLFLYLTGRGAMLRLDPNASPKFPGHVHHYRLCSRPRGVDGTQVGLFMEVP